MNNKLFTSALAVLLIIAVALPATLFIAPKRTSAQFNLLSAASCLGIISGATSLVTDVATSGLAVPVSDMITRVQTTATAGATKQDCITTSILIPLARVMARLALAKITGSIIGWITGKNSSGTTMFVQNLQGNLQAVGDSRANAFFAQFGRNSNSPFASAITSSLRINYLQNTSSAGFFAANRNTMAQYSPNPNAFLNGDWSQGGIGAWFALTTQNQNNPYTLYQASQSHLASIVGGAQAARATELNWGRGFLSWCSANDASAPVSEEEFPVGGGTNPGDPCTNADGTPGTIQTPGSIVHDFTQKAVVNAGIDQLISAQDLDAALGAIATAMVGQVLNGVSGLFGASTPQGGRPALTTQLQSYSAGNTTASASATSIVQTVQANLTTYTSAWEAIRSSANTASSSVTALVTYCNSQMTEEFASPTAINAQLTAAQIARTEIAPVLARAQSAINSVAPTQALARKVQSDASSTNSITSATTGAAGALSTDVQTLAVMPPSASDVAVAQQNSQPFGGARANPTGSLTVSGGSLVDQMNLISTNAAALQALCTPVPPVVNNQNDSSG